MSIIATLGSLAQTATKFAPAVIAAKNTITKASSKKGASVVPKKEIPLPDDTKLYQDLNVTT